MTIHTSNKIILTETELLGLIRETLLEVISTSDLKSSSDASSRLATTDLRRDTRSSSDTGGKDSGDTDLEAGCDDIVVINDLNSFPSIAKRIFEKFFSDLSASGYSDY